MTFGAIWVISFDNQSDRPAYSGGADRGVTMESKGKTAKKAVGAAGVKKHLGESLGFGKPNYILLAVGLGLIILGYIFLAGGSITIAPILLVLGYCVFLPLGILLNPERKKKTGGETSPGTE